MYALNTLFVSINQLLGEERGLYCIGLNNFIERLIKKAIMYFT